MGHKELFKALLACTSKDATRGILQYIAEVGGDETERTLCAADGPIVAVINIPVESIERAILDDIIVKITNEYGTFYINRKRRNLNECECTYPNVRAVFPALKPYDTDRGPRATFRASVTERMENLASAVTGMKITIDKVPGITHYPVNKTKDGYEDASNESIMMHACVLKEGVIGVMPIRVNCDTTEIIDNAFDHFTTKGAN